MKKLGRNSLALGAATLLVTAAVQFSANGAPGDVAQSNSSAVTATGLTGIVDSEQCTAESADGTPTDGAGRCGTGLSTSGVNAFDQTASTGLDGDKGTSEALAAVAPIDIAELTTIDLSTTADDILAINTGTILDDVIEGLGPILGPLLETVLDPVLTAVQDSVIAPLTSALQDAIPVKVEIGAVSSQCTAVAGEAATGTSTVAGINVIVELPGNPIVVPITLDTAANSNLLVNAPVQLVDGLIDGLEDTLEQSLNGILGPVAGLLDAALQPIVDGVFDAIEPILQAAADGLDPLVNGTVNKQVDGSGAPVDGSSADGAIEVTALELNVLSTGATLDLARTSCGPNALAAADDQDTVADADADQDADAVADQDADAVADADADQDADADAIADADSAADADASAALPDAGAPNLMPFFLLGIALVAFGLAVLVNERRRFNDVA